MINQNYQQYPYTMTGAMPSQHINWVQGIEGAKAYQLPMNSNCIMLDSENEGIFYIKTSDNVGMCNLRVFKFTEITDQQNQKINPEDYVKKSELEGLINQMLGGNSNEQPISAIKPKTITG